MKHAFFRLVFTILFFTAYSNLFGTTLIINFNDGKNNLKEFFDKEKVTILITDSGLGGLSVCAGLESVFATLHEFKELKLIFVNALHPSGIGYNSMNKDEQVKNLDMFLTRIIKNYKPDLILIACNTLSVIYTQTRFAYADSIPVIGIVDFGVNMIYEKLDNINNSSVIILGTEITINSNTHRDKLIAKGIQADRIITQSCPKLESEIQIDPHSDMVYNMIDFYLEEAKSKLDDDKKPVYIGLCCSHYGFSEEVFKKIINEENNFKMEILNPNERMIKLLINPELKNRYTSTNLEIKVISGAVISQEELEAIGNTLEENSPKTVYALKNYDLNKNLF